MPRIRKKTSKRTKTHERARLHKQIKETKRKKARDAKKNPQWKSKQKKDPGIPNNFPYKDQVLAEVQEQRRLAAEEKQRIKDEKKALKSGFVAEEENLEGSDNEGSSTSQADEDDGENENDKEGVGSISAKRIASSRISTRPQVEAVEEEEEEEEDAPLLINRDLPHLKSVLDKADVVIQLLDARDPLSFRSTHLEQTLAATPEKQLVYVLTKIDNAPREAVTAWSSTLRKYHPTLLFRSATAFLPDNPRIPEDVKGKQKAGKKPSDDAIGVDAILKLLGDWASEKKKKRKKEEEPLTIAVVGVANVGKSSFINSLLKKSTFPIYTPTSKVAGPTTTFLPQEQELTVDGTGSSIRFIDTPGFSWDWDSSTAETRCHDILIRNRGRIDKLKDPLPPVTEIVSRGNTEDLMLLYSLPAYPKGDVDAFLAGVARSQQFVKKRGVLDIATATRMVLRDWNVGKLRYYCMPSPSSQEDRDVAGGVKVPEATYGQDEAIISSLMPRKDMRKTGGLVKLTPGTVDARKLALDQEYDDANDGEESDEDDDDEMEVDELDGSDEDEEGEEDEEDEDEEQEDEEEDEEKPALPPVKQKRKRTTKQTAALPPKKKVAFSSDTKKAAKAPPPPKAKRVANKPSKSKPAAAASSGGGGEAYDFKKFF